jgi:Domain of unknown function (DUF4386)
MLLVQLAGLIVPFVLLLPLTTGPQQYLVDAAATSGGIELAVVLLLVNCTLTVGITLAVFRRFSEQSQVLALALLTASIAMLVMQAVDNIHVLSMLSLSQQHAHEAGSGGGLLALATAVGATRRWAHLSELLSIDCWVLLFYWGLYRFALVPRGLAVFGLVTVLLHFIGVPLSGFLGLPSVTPMATAMAFSHIALAAWLLVKGFPFTERAQ